MLFPLALFASLLVPQQIAPAAQPPAPAQAPAVAPRPEATTLPNVEVAATPAEPARFCRMEPVLGSRFGRRVCRSVSQTREDRANSREMLRQMQGARTPPVG